jgi:hypothetical protein
MVTKPNILIGIKSNGEMEAIAVSDNADLIKKAFDKERDNPSGKYVMIKEYRRPPFRRRRDLSQCLPRIWKNPASKAK